MYGLCAGWSCRTYYPINIVSLCLPHNSTSMQATGNEDDDSRQNAKAPLTPTIPARHSSHITISPSSNAASVPDHIPVVHRLRLSRHRLWSYFYSSLHVSQIRAMTSASAPAAALLSRQLKEMRTSKDIPGISCGLVDENNVFLWEVVLMISDDCKYYGGMCLLDEAYLVR